MSKLILGVVAGLVAWVAIVIVAGTIMRLAWPAYAAVEAAMTFTLPMLMGPPCDKCRGDSCHRADHGDDRPAVCVRETDAWRASAHHVHSCAHHAVEQVSCLVPPHFPLFARASHGRRRTISRERRGNGAPQVVMP